MRFSLGWLVLSFACGMFCLASLATVAMASESGSGGESSALTGNPLVIEGEESLVGGQRAAAEEVRLSSPEAVADRLASATAFEGLSASGAEKLANEVFPSLMNDRNGGPPSLPEGDKLTGFVEGNVAQAEFGEGYRGVVQSSVPMAIKNSSGVWMPVDLGLHETHGVVEPTNPLVSVSLPKRSLSEGAQLSSLGLTVTPVQAQEMQGSSDTSVEGSLDGAGLFFANIATDTDTVLKPTSFGFAMDFLLRSARSPEQLSLHVGLPSGASLVEVAGSGFVDVVREGVTIATVPPPVAHDAAGTFVPVSMHVSGDVLTLTVPHSKPGGVQFPVDVDPEFTEASESLSTANWHFSEATNGKFIMQRTGGELAMIHEGSFPAANWATVGMETKGQSKIFKFTIEKDDLWAHIIGSEPGYESTEPYVAAWIELYKEGSESSRYTTLSGTPYLQNASVCANSECTAAGGVNNNVVDFAVSTTESSKYLEENKLYELVPYGAAMSKSTTYISQAGTLHSTVKFNTTEPEIAKTVNVLAGSGWMSAHQGAFEWSGRDLGTGLSGVYFEEYSGGSWSRFASKSYLETVGCIGIQCVSEEKEALTYESKVGPYPLANYLPNGEDRLRISPHDAAAGTAAGEHGEGEITLMVDTTAPHGIVLSGLALKGEEYELGEVEAHLKIEATDGEGSVPSSGIKAIEFEVDGHEVGKPAGSCSRGPCTATGEWSINGAELGTGLHVMTVVARDNAGNIATKEFKVNVYHAAPVGLGPGSVNPESGDYALEATDVNMSGGMGDLTVSRHYDSRNLKEGVEGPLGPQWTISLGSLAALEVLPDGSIMVIGPEGLTHFSKKTGGGFEPPKGDSNLKLEPKEEGGTVVAYLFKNPTKGTTTKFTLPAGAKSWMPTVSEGPVATDTTTDEYRSVEGEEGKKIIQPILEVAPHPQATCSHEQLEKLAVAARGCRALELVYSSSTSAKGEGKTEWGNFKNHLIDVRFIAWNPASKTMVAQEVAHYLYDGLGRLRSEWDPRISPALETTYGYDPEGHVTAITPPGQETIAFTYGTIPGDLSTGRLLKLTRAPASASLWTGEPQKQVEKPMLSGSPVPGVRLTVTDGSWSQAPVVYGFQWNLCSARGGECAPIAGATNQNFTPSTSDLGHVLRNYPKTRGTAGLCSP